MIGTTLGNRYKILKKIGGGGMAEVYTALDYVLDKEVAIKILRSQYVHDNSFISRFRREAHSVSSLSHENVVSIFDVGEENDVYYIVMEYIDGYTLKELIQKKGSIQVEEALEIARKICSALDHAHQNNIVHRDIKPHNILIGLNSVVKVTDFGIARAVSQATITHTGSVLGSVHYLSPEQARGGYIDEKTDLYSLGVVIYEMVTGKLPFSGDSPITVALKHLQENFVYPKEIDPNIPQSVENIILKALVKNPSKRYSSAKEMFADLKTALNPERINEPQLELESFNLSDDYDDEKTLIIPAIRDANIDENSYSAQSRKSKKRNFSGMLSILFGLLLFISLGVFGFQYIGDKFVVPEIELPMLEGMQKGEAINKLSELNLDYTIVDRFDPVVKEGVIIKQSPFQGSVIKANQIVTLYVSLGKKNVPMPDVRNEQKKQASFLLAQQGFLNIEIIDTYNDEATSGEVYKQEPLPGEMVIPDETKIILFASKGKEKFEMPNLIGLTEEEALAILYKNDLESSVKKDYTLEQEKGKVYRQFPYEPGREVTSGDQVDLFVSLGYPKNAKIKYGDVLVALNDDEEAKISIIIRDSRDKDLLWKQEVITGSKLYDEIKLVLMPGEKGSIRVYKNDKLIQVISINN